MPWIVKTFVNIMWPFVDPVTKKKVRFGSLEAVQGEILPPHLLKECGGDLNVSCTVSADWVELLRC